MRESVDLKKLLLMNILQYFKNQYTGFTATLRDLQTDPEKEKFITDCKRLVESGWSAYFDKIESFDVFQPYLTDPEEHLHVTAPQIDIARFLIRLCIFKLIATACEENPALNKDKTWFRHMRDTLNKEFENLCSGNQNIVHMFDGHKISSLQDLERLTQQIRREIAWSAGGTIGIVCFLAVSSFFKLFEHAYANSTVRRYLPAAFLLVLCGMLGLMLKQMIQRGRIQFFVDHTSRQIQRAPRIQANPELMTDREIAQHILVSDALLDKLEANVPRSAP